MVLLDSLVPVVFSAFCMYSDASEDIVFIFDYSQADTLMPQTIEGGTDGVDAVRITVYRLPQSHLVWLGWGMMLLGMAALGLRNVGQASSSSAAV